MQHSPHSAVSMLLKIFARKARSLVRRTWFEKLWFLPVWFLLGASRFVILFIPFRRLAPRLGMRAGIAPWVPLIDPACEDQALRIARVVAMASRYTPWVSNCFPQALAARALLGLYGVPYSLFFGVSLDSADAEMGAHAWVNSGRVCVTGGGGFGKFTVVSCFVAQVCHDTPGI